MGRTDRERSRAGEQTRGSRWQGPPGGARAFPRERGESSPEEMVAGLLSAAVDARLNAGRPEFPRLVETLAGDPGLRPVVDRALLGMLGGNLARAWRNGWMPADVVRLVGRRFGPRHACLAVDAVAAEMRAYAPATVDERWQDQLTALDATVWWGRDEDYLREDGDRTAMVARALEVIILLATLQPLERLCPPPGSARRTARTAGRVDERMLARVRALLAKAESTEFEAEAETFTAAAQSLMARYSIDAALLAAGAANRPDDEPQGRRLGIDAPYEEPKAVLLDVIASANHCRSIWSRHLGFATVLGFPAGLAAVEVLFTSLLVQATTAMRQAGARRDGAGRSRTRSFRQSFLAAYAYRIGERLHEAAGEAVRQAAAETSRDLLPVLAARDQAVDAAMEKMFPELSMVRTGSVGNREGWISGRAAADQAVLDVHPKIPSGSSSRGRDRGTGNG
ncbi:DUF2786 domain-containing protein [Microbispora sp. H10670]|uniref:DUF2786 domain-containing protein n=1 Tax=Microbispora sp. H10670 TaxID=2729108 RepID=UPI0016030DAE|nr:DUF2786 domain-containing protein [Microbispora sp. H10670]